MTVSDGFNIATATTSVTVVDTTAPTVTAPDDIQVEATSAAGISSADSAIVAFLADVMASDIVDPDLTITNDAPATFPVGTTRVTFTATDDFDQQGTATADVIVTSAEVFDFGDAPAAFPVALAQDGARHTPGSLTLGTQIDSETDGTPSVDASGDGADDGITALTTAIADSVSPTIASFAIVASADGKLDAWIDFNSDGTWQASEQIFDSVDVTAGANTLSCTIPAGASTDGSAARFRLSTAGGLEVTGAASDGEVEDYLITLQAAGSGNVDVTSFNPGTVTIETSGDDVIVREGSMILFQGPAAELAVIDFTGTGEDDTILFSTTLANFTGTVEIDGGDGDDSIFIEGSDQDLDLTALPEGSVDGIEIVNLQGDGDNRLTLTEDQVASLPDEGKTLRVIKDPTDDVTFTTGNFTVTGSTTEDGVVVIEVESESTTIQFTGTQWTNPIKRTNVNGVSGVTASDALAVINQLNAPTSDFYTGPSTLIDTGQLATPFPLFFFDVTGDGDLTARDALQIINLLNSGGGSPEPLPAGEPIPVASPTESQNDLVDTDERSEQNIANHLSMQRKLVSLSVEASSTFDSSTFPPSTSSTRPQAVASQTENVSELLQWQQGADDWFAELGRR